MKRFALMIAALALGAGTSKAATYTITSTPHTFQNISGTGTGHMAGADDSFIQHNLANPFTFFDQTYNSIFVSSNGLITFGGGTTQFANTALSVSPNLPAIAVLWDDWQFFQAGADRVYTQNFADRTVVQWNFAHGFFSSPSSVTFQAVLFNNGDIRLNYADTFSGDSRNFGGSATVGVRNANGSDITQYSFNQAIIGSQTSLQLTPVPVPPTAVLAVVGFAGMGGFGWARRRKAAVAA